MTFSNKRGASDLTIAAYTDEGLKEADAAAAAFNPGLPHMPHHPQDPTGMSTTNTVPAPTASLADISDGAKRLAQELDQYITRGPDVLAAASPSQGGSNYNKDASLSDDAIADLQLATARKLREVCRIV